MAGSENPRRTVGSPRDGHGVPAQPLTGAPTSADDGIADRLRDSVPPAAQGADGDGSSDPTWRAQCRLC